ncbi:MAG: hypothetical protein KDA89_21865, partial [Planctomycetaceae bacterium]|nr:hypothetical protein [Planctomycetaceae bacterium]
ADAAADFQRRKSEYEVLVRDLSAQLRDSATSSSPESESDRDLVRELGDRIAELEQELHERASAEHVTGEMASTAGSASGYSPEEINVLQRELDDRTVLLDQREEDLRERQRRLENMEGEIEQQRRQLREVRQQIEQARVEVQFAGHAVADVDEEPFRPASGMQPEMPEPGDHETLENHSAEATSHLRSELAEMFGISGLTGSSQAKHAPDVEESELPAVDDYSQEKSATVTMHFRDAEQVLIEDTDSAENGDNEHQETDDFVANYMEQLLARSRQQAGQSLPEELKSASQPARTPAPPAAGKKEQPAPPPKAEAPKPKKAGPKSFIEAYMAGEYDTGSGESPAAESVAAHTNHDDHDAAAVPKSAPRQRINLDTLRNDMHSFRELSTQQVEKALATHARRREQGGIQARITILTVLAILSVFILSAALMEVIPMGLFVVVVIVATVVSAVELLIKFSSINSRIRQLSSGLNAGAERDAVESESLSGGKSVRKDVESDDSAAHPSEAMAHEAAAPGDDSVAVSPNTPSDRTGRTTAEKRPELITPSDLLPAVVLLADLLPNDTEDEGDRYYEV